MGGWDLMLTIKDTTNTPYSDVGKFLANLLDPCCIYIMHILLCILLLLLYIYIYIYIYIYYCVYYYYVYILLCCIYILQSLFLA